MRMNSIQNMALNSINTPFCDFSCYFWTIKSNQNLSAAMASGHGLLAWVHSVNAHIVSAQSDFSRATMQTMQFLHPSRPKSKQAYHRSWGKRRINFHVTSLLMLFRFWTKLVAGQDRKRRYTPITGMVADRFLRERRSNESTKTGSRGNVIAAIYQKCRFDYGGTVILSGGQWFAGRSLPKGSLRGKDLMKPLKK